MSSDGEKKNDGVRETTFEEDVLEIFGEPPIELERIHELNRWREETRLRRARDAARRRDVESAHIITQSEQPRSFTLSPPPPQPSSSIRQRASPTIVHPNAFK